ncbi:hypothetical protein CR513_30403, partial [Mucuna pruriens]
MLLLQEFDVEIRDKKGAKNVVADHLSRLEREAGLMLIGDEFSDEQILWMTHATPWYANIYNFLVTSTYPIGASKVAKERLESDAKLCNDQSPRSSQSSTSIMQQSMEAIMDLIEQPEKSSIVG